uniref:Putative PKS-NRPS hybrid synthetase / FAR1-related n=1 Tax=Papaver somniferum TaxID=3469 RepID=A0A481S763_PAPSO|nr:putative PKS-NRPS hybrid synthetase / FAR1-related [Papaver somniferum]
MQQLRHLGEKYNYSVFHDEDEDKQIKHLILAHLEFIKLVRCSNQLLLMDCTYKTNKYEIPVLNIVGQTTTNSPFDVAFFFLEDDLEESYVWELKQVKLFCVEGYTPKVIVTDKEQALLNAIARVFPDAHHLVCTFHLWKSIETKCVSHPAIDVIMKEVQHFELGNFDGGECVCPHMTSLGLPCRHVIANYNDKVIPIQNVDPFWQQISFHETKVDQDFGGTFVDTILEKR